VLDGCADPTREVAILRAGGGGKCDRPSRCLDMSGGRYSPSDSAGGSTRLVHIPIRCTTEDAHCRHMANTTEPSVLGCHITLICLKKSFYKTRESGKLPL